MNWLKNYLLPAGSRDHEVTTPFRRHRLALPVGIIALMLIFTSAAARAEGPRTAQKDSVTPPPVPVDVQVERGNEAFLVGHATGTQNYVCLPCDATKPNCPFGVAYSLFTPQATLFDD